MIDRAAFSDGCGILADCLGKFIGGVGGCGVLCEMICERILFSCGVELTPPQRDSEDCGR